MRPAWAAGVAGNMENFPVVEGVKQLVILADNDSGGIGQAAAEECARRWYGAGRQRFA
jgi:putative DNA primase/helicase